jgi:hypothetical protein
MTPNCLRNIVLTITFACLCWPLLGCGKSLQGTYHNDNGSATLDLKSGGQADFTFLGQSLTCKYESKGDRLTLDCGKEKIDFLIHEDGSLTGPPANMVGTLRKAKS